MKKIMILLVAALTAVSFASLAMASSHMKDEAKPAEAAAPAAEKKDVKKAKKAAKKDEKKKEEAKPAAKGKKEVSGC